MAVNVVPDINVFSLEFEHYDMLPLPSLNGIEGEGERGREAKLCCPPNDLEIFA
jgi:hypothetical protein